MNAEQEWTIFLEKNPLFYEISKGRFFIQFLEVIAPGAKCFSDLNALFPLIEDEDLHQIMDVLLRLKVVSRMTVDNRVFFAITPEGTRFLSAYANAKKFFCT